MKDYEFKTTCHVATSLTVLTVALAASAIGPAA